MFCTKQEFGSFLLVGFVDDDGVESLSSDDVKSGQALRTRAVSRPLNSGSSFKWLPSHCSYYLLDPVANFWFEDRRAQVFIERVAEATPRGSHRFRSGGGPSPDCS